MRIIWVLSAKLRGNCLVLGSEIRELFRFTEAALLASSMNLSCMALLPLGIGMAGQRHIPLNLMMNKIPPIKVPAL